MITRFKKLAELLCLTLYATITMLGVCWGPPLPPSVPVSPAETIGLTVVGMAAYGFWKMRK